MRLRQCHESTWTWMKDKLRVVKPADMESLGGVDVWFASGSLKFVTDPGIGPKDTPSLVWLSKGSRRKPANPEWQWIAVSHASVGGTTTASGMFGTRGFGPVHVPLDPIRRFIGHVLKYSERPVPCSVPVQEDHYTVNHRLSLHKVDKSVVFSTGFSRTGWGKRPLVALELAQAFDLPSYLGWSNHFATEIAPLHLFRVTAEAALGTLAPRDPKISQSRHQRPCIRPEEYLDVSPADATWIPGINKWLPGAWSLALIADKAVKADNAAVDFSPWHNRIRLIFSCPVQSLTSLELLGVRVWRRTLCKSFNAYLSREYGKNWNALLSGDVLSQRQGTGGATMDKRCKISSGYATGNVEGGVVGEGEVVGEVERTTELLRDLEKGRAVLSQVLQSTWWEWTFGSALYFWRWNGIEQQRAARDGMRSYVQSPLPVGRRPKRVKANPEVRDMVVGKIEGMARRYYLESGHVSNSLDYFAVPKGDADVRVVFDGSSCGLNKALWSPNFFLPTASSAAMLLSFGTWMADMDFEEMFFHNFPMEDRLRKCSGVEVEGDGKVSKLLRWTRMFMGLRPSPYCAVRYYYWGEEFARGDPGESSNPMGYDAIRLNLPGMDDYDPQWPKVMKWVRDRGVVAGDVITFVDDVRITGFSKENCHQVHRQFASRIQWLGMQDAPRKFRPPSQLQAGAWTGAIFKITHDTISKSVSQEKWDKGKEMINRLRSICETSSDFRPMINRKELEKETGFLNHLGMTFEVLVPYLKGYYLTLNSWRSHRDEGDWKMTDKRWRRMWFDRFESGDVSKEEFDA
ncbi:hypothetical protein MHU86_6286 [Fragilaria crotonensis]|nr:hypothetical protein MHU86_6286 [Fragilaria crotonensis]